MSPKRYGKPGGPGARMAEAKAKAAAKAAEGLQKIKEAARKAPGKAAKGPPAFKLSQEPVIDPVKVREVSEEIKDRRLAEDRERQDKVNADHEARRKAEASAKPSAPERSEEPMSREVKTLPWGYGEHVPLGRQINTASVDTQEARRHSLVCAYQWLFNLMNDEERFYPAANDLGIFNRAAAIRMQILELIEAFDKRATEETAGKYKPWATLEMLQQGITREEYERAQRAESAAV